MKRKLLILVIVIILLLLLVSLALLLSGEPLFPFWSDGSAVTDAPNQPAEKPTGPAEESSVPPPPAMAPLPTPEPQFAAEQLALSVEEAEDASAALFDANYYTDFTFPAGTTLTLTAEKEISSLYIIFGTYPDSWTLSCRETVQNCGQEGFLHEYVELESPSGTVQISLSDEHEVMIRDIYAFTEGYLPTYVQTWQNLSGCADILIFSTHYDDELLFFGGMIPYYSVVRDLKVQVAYMTSNYLSSFSNYYLRPHEALNGLWVAGTHFYPVTNEVDDYECRSYWAAVDHYGEDEFVEFQVEQIRRFKPLVVVTHDENGEYGHGAHMLSAYSLERAVEAAADPAQFPESAEQYGVWDTPKTYLHLYDGADDYTWLSYEMRAPELGWRSPFQVAQEAYRQHVTQQIWEGFYVYGFDHPHDSHRYGLYRSLVGPDTLHNDLMEHVTREMFPAD